MDLSHVLVLNLIAIACIAVLGGLFNVTEPAGGGRVFSFFWSLWCCLCLSGTGWVIFVVVHFLRRYW